MLKNFEWNSEFAYAIGLITTDGNLSKDGRHLDLTSKDLEQIKNFKRILNLSNKVGRKGSGTTLGKKYYRVGFGSVDLYRFLLSIGLTPRKSKTIGALKIPDRFFLDFLRGHLDGDGSVITYLDQYNFYRRRNYTNLRVMVYFISASTEHLVWLQASIIRILGLRGALIEGKLPRLKFSKKESINLLKNIYYEPNLVCLSRKKLIAKRILEKVSLEKRKTYEKYTSDSEAIKLQNLEI